VTSKKNYKSLAQVPMPGMSAIETSKVRKEIEFEKVVVDVHELSIAHAVDDQR